MKYIKTFESNTIFKKYVVWKDKTWKDKNKNVFIIFEVEDDIFVLGTTLCQFKKLYLYYPDSNILREQPDNTIFPFNEDEVKEHVIYESDSLGELLDIDFLESLFNADKYNL